MCGTCDVNRTSIARNAEQIRKNIASIKKIREDKKRVDENFSRTIKLAKDPRSKAHYRKQKAASKVTFDNKIKPLKTQSERLREDNKRKREDIRRRHKR